MKKGKVIHVQFRKDEEDAIVAFLDKLALSIRNSRFVKAWFEFWF